MLSQNEIQKQLDFNTELIKRLKPYYKRQAKNLPDDIFKDLHKIQIGPNITTSGLEQVNTILKYIYIANFYLEEAIKDRETFEKIYSQKNNLPKDEKSTTSPPKPENTKIQIAIPPSNQPTSKNDQALNPKPSIKISIDNNTENNIKSNLQPKTNNISSNLVDKNKPDTPPPSSNIEL